MIQVEHFTYRYGSFCAVDDISFNVQKGEIVALIGPNGAGKSTTMKVLTTQLRPTAGKITVAGHDVASEPMEVRKNLGYLPENNPLYGDLIVYDALHSIARQRKIRGNECDQAVDDVARQCGITEVMHRPICTLSKGYRQRVGIAQAIIHKPPVLILDEATTGLDPNQIREIRDLILSIGREKTVLLSTHILQEVSAIANRIILLHQGKIACDGKIDDLLNHLSMDSIEDLFAHYTKKDV